ncbi:helix-turn-helix transcriptional regulator [Fusobacterium sp. PH5-44]|uniref:helix-turn-helix transcriptional regulator n=1 Tax=unclassified Fusobacterium TaxID=2648384 RepID=UPI003D23FCF9
MANTIRISRKLIRLRGKRTQEEVAQALGITRSALSNYEQGVRVPKDDIKIKIARYYRTTVQEIFFE